MANKFEAFLALTRLGISHFTYNTVPPIDWQYIQEIAVQQGLYAVVLDGIEKLPEGMRPPQSILLEWIGEVLQGYEYQYEQYCKAVASLAAFYNSHGYKMMVLKGYACSLDWPKPSHRPCGDIDIWQFGEYKKADASLKTEKGIKVNKSHHHHTVFNWGDFMVENHYDFINIHSRRSNAEMEQVFKELGKDDSYFVEMEGTSTGSISKLANKVYLPSPNLHALFLIKHMVSHFASTSITVRHVLDWGFFVKAHTSEIDWGWLWKLLEKFHMKEFLCCVNAICVEELGFSSTIFHGVQFNPSLKDKVLNDILEPAYGIEEPKLLMSRIIYKYRRWKSNSWKRNLCFGESGWTMFWGGVKSHLLKPASI